MVLGIAHFPICSVVENWLTQCMVIFFYVFLFFEILGFKEIWETFCSYFINNFVEMLRMKLFQEDVGKTLVKLEHWKTQVLIYAIFYPGC